MNLDRKLIIGAGAAVVALAFYLFWYMSPYEQCVRASTESGALREIATRDAFPRSRFDTTPYKGDTEIRDAQKRYAQVNCLDNSN